MADELLLDTGAFVALIDRSEKRHADCVEVTGNHIRLVFNRKAYWAPAGALALAELPTGRPVGR